VPSPQVQWATADPSYVTVNSSGLVTGLADGAVTIVSSYRGVAGLSQLTLVDFDIVGPPPSPSKEGDLIITEMMIDPEAVTDAVGEWFEIHNPNSYALELENVRFSDDGTDLFRISESRIIPAGGYMVLGANGDFNINGGVKVVWVFGTQMVLANTNDEINMISPDDVLID